MSASEPDPLHVREARRRLAERPDAPEPGDLLDEIHAACLDIDAPLSEHDQLRSAVARAIVERDRDAAIVAVRDGTRWDDETGVVRCRKCHAQMYAEFICPTAHLFRALAETRDEPPPIDLSALPATVLGVPVRWRHDHEGLPTADCAGGEVEVRVSSYSSDEDEAKPWLITVGCGSLGAARAYIQGRGATLADAEEYTRARLRSARDAAYVLLDDEPLALVVEDRRDETLRFIAGLVRSDTGDPERIVEWVETRIAEHHPELGGES